MLVRWNTTEMRVLAGALVRVSGEIEGGAATIAAEMQRLGRAPLHLSGARDAATWTLTAAVDLQHRADELDRASVALAPLELLLAPRGGGDSAWVTGFDFTWTIEDVLMAGLARIRTERARIETKLRWWWESEAEEAADAIAELELRLGRMAIEELRIERALIATVGGAGAAEAAAELDSVIAYLEYEVAGAELSTPADLHVVGEAARQIRSQLNESWFGDVSRLELQEIGRILASLERAEFNAVVARLSDDELYRWFHELDGVRGGNLTSEEETHLFETVARLGDGDTLWRLANAEFGERFIEIADAVSRVAPAQAAIPFIARCAEAATTSDEAAAAALAGIDRLAPVHQEVALVVLDDAGLIQPLLEVADGLVRRIAGERDDPIPIEVLEGLVESIWAPIRSLGGLTVQGLWDRHAFRRNWAQLGQVFQLLFGDPVGFIRAVIDLEGLVRNPARWIGAVVPAVALTVAGGGAVARIGVTGRLGWRARQIILHVQDFAKRLRRSVEVRWADQVGAIADPRLERMARRMGVGLDSLLFEHRHLTVEEFIRRFCDPALRREIPAEFLGRTLEEVLVQERNDGARRIKELLLDGTERPQP